MQRKSIALPLLTLVSMHAAAQLKYPVAKKTDTVDHYHGVAIPDPYRWLEDDHSEATAAWVKAENEVTENYLSSIPFRRAYKDRLTALQNYEKQSNPFRKGDYYYFYRNSGLQNQSVLYRQRGLDGQPEVVIDPNTLSADGTVRLAAFSLSKNGAFAAYAVSVSGSDWQTIRVRNMQNGKDETDLVEWVKVSGIAWQGNGFYYSRYPQPEGASALSAKNENHQVYFHQLGTPQASDQLVYSDPANPQRFHLAATSEDERFVVLTISDRGKGLEGNSLLFKDSKRPGKNWQAIVAQVGKFRYNWIDNEGDDILVQTNENAPNEKIVRLSARKPSSHKTVVAEKKSPIASVGTAGGSLLVSYLENVSSHVYQHQFDGKLIREVLLPGIGSASGFGGNADDKTIFYSFTSYNYPSTIFSYDLATGQSRLYRSPKLTGFDPALYETVQVFYPSKDGTKIPLFLTYRKGLVKNGDNPVYLYAYGGFTVSLTPGFNASIIPWLEQGGIYAVANLRGGSEFGEQWHEAGMLERKQNVFDDFIAAGEYLIKEKYTQPKKLAIAGGSNGGLLIGAVINQRPELFGVAIPQVGVMDMLRFQKFTIGWNWIAEYGTSDKPDQFRFLYAYSPLHNIRAALPYPPTLITTADHDDRVVPAHSFKYAATLQDSYKGKNPILIRIDTKSGHGASNLSKAIEANADIYSFILYNMGITPQFKP